VLKILKRKLRKSQLDRTNREINVYNCSCDCSYSFCIVCPLLCVCVVLCAVFCLIVVLFCVMCAFCLLCLIVLPLPPGKTPFAVKINNNHHHHNTSQTDHRKIIY
jgi:hypothetical protein